MKRYLLLPVAAALAACVAPAPMGERPAVVPQDIEHITALLKRDFHERGQAKIDRIDLDEVQRICNLNADNPPESLAKPLEEAQMKAIKFPNGSLMGDWKNGERIAQSGRGSMWNDKPGVQQGGSCYNCHQLSPKVEAYGTLGPSLAGFGKIRGNRPEIQQYVYGKIYNAKAYSVCSQMPRFGHAGTLNEQQIKDLVALLLDPKSPVNQ
ncbi:MAG: sulfur oxidation c-type cytochrome SoxX [Betaproteobacteria bacterium RIFCSPLOWO2_12_FULL_67_28]|nr:MAG: sulfur oxidation c-type cytochrome SoxX [Betaproteobacteria bacterium RIFCSPLOWO2_12_FULL_67_28]